MGYEYGAKGYRSAVLYRKPEWYKDLDFSYDMSFPMSRILTRNRAAAAP